MAVPAPNFSQWKRGFVLRHPLFLLKMLVVASAGRPPVSVISSREGWVILIDPHVFGFWAIPASRRAVLERVESSDQA